jgi:hypothetical protein
MEPGRHEMTEAFEFSSPARVGGPGWYGGRAAARPLPTTQQMLIEGGDGRLALDPFTGRNRYGCSPGPDHGLADFGSSTASVISSRGFLAAAALRARLAELAGREPAPAIYAREMQRQRTQLVGLCGLSDMAGLEVVFAASGTDLHLLVGELVGGAPDARLMCVNIEPEETGGGVPAALSGRHFSSHAALGAPVVLGAPIGPSGGEVTALRARARDGSLRAPADLEIELVAAAHAAITGGRRMLLTVSDCSKTGLISPSLSAVLGLRQRFPDTIEVLIDACQFRLAPATLRAYLENGFMVAVTGSKFLTGPAYSGALFVPEEPAARLAGRLLRPELGAYSARGEWPAGWVAGASMAEAANFGLLLRWEAALAELAAFRAIPEAEVEAFLRRFAQAVEARLADDPAFERLDVRALDRAAIGAPSGWDEAPTIFPFLLRHAVGPHEGYLSLAAVQDVYNALMDGERSGGAVRARLGQPVLCGERFGRPISALRLCNSARLAVEGVGGDGANAEAVIAKAMTVLDRTAEAARALSEMGRI